MHHAIIPFGPQHPALPESIYFRLKVDGEEIVDLDLNLGYEHRGIEKSFENRSWYKGIFLASRICGICNHQHGSAYARGVEKLLGIKPPARALYIRTILTELERLQSHMLWAGVAAHEIGFDTLFQYCWRERELVLDCVELISGKRVQYDMISIGGVRSDITNDARKRILENMDKLESGVPTYKKVLTKDATVVARTRGIGVLSASDAAQYSAVGPTARASGIDYDIRKIEPYQAFDKLEFETKTATAGDCLARIKVRFDEIYESIKIIRQALEQMPSGEYKGKPTHIIVPEGEAVARVEAPRGELFYYIKSAGGDKPYRVKIKTPTYGNFPALKSMMVGETIADAPIIILSIDPCICCTDRMEILDINKGKSRIMTSHDMTALKGDLHDH